MLKIIRTLSEMTKIILTLIGVAVGVIAILVAIVYWIPATVPGWMADSHIAAGPDAREIAAALSTPPTHLVQATKFALYHWQTLIAGVLAFIGGLGAFGAAYIGAQALRHQTATAVQMAQDQLADQERREVAAHNRAVRQMANALAAEVEYLVAAAKDSRINVWLKNNRVNAVDFQDIINSMFYRLDTPHIYNAVSRDIGILPHGISGQTVRFYNSRTMLIIAMQKIKDNPIPSDRNDLAEELRQAITNYSDTAINAGDDLVVALRGI